MRVLAVGALVAGVLFAVLIIVLLIHASSGTPAAQTRPGAPAARSPAPAQASAPPSATATATAAPAPARPLSATATVVAFYRRAAARDYRAAWQLAGPAMRLAFDNSYERFRTDLSSLRHIEFKRVAIVDRSDTGATVQIETIATHTDRVDHCTGTLHTVRDRRGRWLVDPAGVRCAGE